MLSGTVEAECRWRRRVILLGNAGADAIAATSVVISSWADDAPNRRATKALAHATIQPAIYGAATTGSELAHSIAVH
jgi:hypothetical protein